MSFPYPGESPGWPARREAQRREPGPPISYFRRIHTVTLLQKLQAIATALQDILTLSGQVQTELTALNTFLDTV